MMTKNNIISCGRGEYGKYEKVVLHTYKLAKEVIVPRKKWLCYE